MVFIFEMESIMSPFSVYWPPRCKTTSPKTNCMKGKKITVNSGLTLGIVKWVKAERRERERKMLLNSLVHSLPKPSSRLPHITCQPCTVSLPSSHSWNALQHCWTSPTVTFINTVSFTQLFQHSAQKNTQLKTFP